MGIINSVRKCAVTVIWIVFASTTSLFAQEVDVEALLLELADPATENWQAVERKIRNEWSRSGSAAMDLLYQRGEKALEDQDYTKAMEHFTALTDHAPDFAEGWNARATVLFHQENYGPAMDDLSKALSLNPNHFGAMTGLAVILGSVGMKKESLEIWRMVFAIHPHRPETLEAIGHLEKEIAGEAL